MVRQCVLTLRAAARSMAPDKAFSVTPMRAFSCCAGGTGTHGSQPLPSGANASRITIACTSRGRRSNHHSCHLKGINVDKHSRQPCDAHVLRGSPYEVHEALEGAEGDERRNRRDSKLDGVRRECPFDRIVMAP